MPVATSMLLEFFEQISKIRAFEEAVAEGYRDRRLPGLLHLSMGSEATAVGVISSLAGGDKIYSSHRPHGHFLASGTDPAALMAELAGMESGLCRGRAGSMHLMDDRAVMATGIVGGTISIALGHSLVLKPPEIVVVFFGDGAVQTGTFHETMNMAALWKAPVVFVCENNERIEFSSREEHTPVTDLTGYGRLYGMRSEKVDGCDVEAVFQSFTSLATDARDRVAPALLICDISRLRPHYEGDLRQQEAASDPLEKCISRLTHLGWYKDDLGRRHNQAVDNARALLETVLKEGVLADPADDIALVFKKSLQ